jgi:hypothetical protein
VTCYTQPCKLCKVKYILDYLPQGGESPPRGRWGICAPALPEVLTHNTHNIIVFSELENVLSTEQCRYNVPTKKNVPTNIQQAVAMSNNDDMEIDIDIGCGLRGTTDKSVQQKARGEKSDHRGLEEREREQ